MSIVRAKRSDRGFTMLDNDVLRDERLSYRARGLLAAILSRPDDWRTDYRSLARQGREGETAVRSALKELRDAGYIVQVKRQVERGRWETVNIVHDQPQHASSQVAPSAGKPKLGGPKLGEPAPIQRTETKHRDKDGSDDRNAGLPAGSNAPRPTAKKDRKPTRAQIERWNADYTELIKICREIGEEDPYSIWWTLRLEHKAAAPSRFLRTLVDTGQWDGFVGRHGISTYERPGKTA